MSSPMVSAFQPGIVGTNIARFVLPQAEGNAAAMYFDAPSGEQTAMGIHAPAEAKLVLGLNGLSLLVFGLVPSGLMVLCAQAITELLV